MRGCDDAPPVDDPNPPSRHRPVSASARVALATQPDRRLIALVAGGKPGAFEEIVRRYRAPLLRYARALLGDARAEDAVQQAFLNAYRFLRCGDSEPDLRPWLYRLTRNAAIDVVREQARHDRQLDVGRAVGETPHQELVRREQVRELLSGLAALPARQRDAIVLRELEGRGHAEIATRLGLSDGSVRQLIFRARASLRNAAALLVPPGVLERLAFGGTGESPGRVAGLLAAGGGAAAVGKGAAAVLAGGAIVLGGARVLPVAPAVPEPAPALAATPPSEPTRPPTAERSSSPGGPQLARTNLAFRKAAGATSRARRSGSGQRLAVEEQGGEHEPRSERDEDDRGNPEDASGGRERQDTESSEREAGAAVEDSDTSAPEDASERETSDVDQPEAPSHTAQEPADEPDEDPDLPEPVLPDSSGD